MSHIQSSPHPALPVVDEINDSLSRLSTRESTYSAVTLVNLKLNNQDRPRSTPRARDRQYQSSGIGGIGNIRASSAPTERAHVPDGPDDFSSTWGREPRSQFHVDKVISIGRGGAGNIRSPSRDVSGSPPSETSSVSETQQIEYERAIIRNREAARAQHSGGRAGIGNTVRRDPQSQSLFWSRSRGSETRATSQIGHGTNDLASQGTPEVHGHTGKLLPGRSFLGRRPREILNAIRDISNLCQRKFGMVNTQMVVWEKGQA